MATEKDAGRDKRLVIAIVTASLVGLGALLYLAWSWLASPTEARSKIAVNNVVNPARKKTDETPAYRELLAQQNAQGAKNAREENSSFIASIQTGQAEPEIVPEPVKPPPPKKTVRPAARKSAQKEGLSDDQKKAVQALVLQISGDTPKALSTASLALAIEPGQEPGSANDKDSSAFAGWTASVMPQQAAARSASQMAASAFPAAIIIPAYTRAPGTIDVGVDSDNSAVPVTGRIWSGPWAGASLKADGSKLAGDGVVVHFTSMTWKNQTYRVDAYALKDDTLMANVATTVSNRYLERVWIPAIANGIGKAGDLYADANTTILTNDYGTVSSHAGMPDSTAVAGVVAGGIASEGASVLRADAAKLPAKQVTVKAGQPVYIQFMTAVTTADEVTQKTKTATQAQSVSVQPASSSRLSAAERRANNAALIPSPVTTGHAETESAHE